MLDPVPVEVKARASLGGGAGIRAPFLPAAPAVGDVDGGLDRPAAGASALCAGADHAPSGAARSPLVLRFANSVG